MDSPGRAEMLGMQASNRCLRCSQVIDATDVVNITHHTTLPNTTLPNTTLHRVIWATPPVACVNTVSVLELERREHVHSTAFVIF